MSPGAMLGRLLTLFHLILIVSLEAEATRVLGGKTRGGGELGVWRGINSKLERPPDSIRM